MKKFGLIGVAAVSFSVLASPVWAGNHLAQSIYCATREPGNPHSKYCDYIEWSKWRERGGWDPSLDVACYHNPAFVPGECGLDPRSRAY
jgi:hypothetical protein